MKAVVDFVEILTAAMLDAAVEGQMTQLRCTMDTEKHGQRLVRVVVVPEDMQFNFPKGIKRNDEAN